jgi:phosphomannomutase/phosphoglucomutase
MSIVNPNVFREYDIRGVADRDLPDDLARDLGRALGTFLRRAGKHRIAVGRDCRSRRGCSRRGSCSSISACSRRR